MDEHRHNIRIDGVLNVVAGIHVAAFGSSYQGGNHTDQMTKSIAVFTTNEETGAVRPARVPYVPANSIRGRIRRAIASRAKRALAEKGVRIGKGEYYLMTMGSASRAGAKGDFRVDDYDAVYSDPILGIFGAETNYPSRLTTADMVPVTEETIEACAIPEVFHAALMPVSGWQLIDKVTLTAKDDFTDQRDPEAPAVIEDYEQAYVDTAQAYAESRSKRKSGEADAVKQDMSNIMSFSIIMAGTKLYCSITGRDLTEAQCGLLVQGIADALINQGLGGNTRYGYGKVDGMLQVSLDGGEREDAVAIDATGQAVMSETIKPLVAAGDKAIADYDGEVLKRLVSRRQAA